MTPTPSPTDWQREIEELHGFFQGWLGGTVARTEQAFARLDRALDPAFTMITPAGRPLERDALLEAVRAGYGTVSGLRIEIHGTRLLHDGPEIVAAVYREAQHTVEEGTERPGTERCGTGRRGTERLSTVLFRRRQDAPHGLAWLHVHETWSAESGGEG